MTARSIGMAAVGAIVLLMTASAGPRPAAQTSGASRIPPPPMAALPTGMLPLPVLTTRAELRDGELLPVCMYHGARPWPLQVITANCGSNEGHCTAMVAVPWDTPMAFLEYNAANPAVSTTLDGQCERPYRRAPAGILAPRAEG